MTTVNDRAAARPDSGRALPAGLAVATAFFAVAVAVHTADHLRRGFGVLDTDVAVAGWAALFVEVGVVALVVARHRLAPMAAALAGFSLAAGYLLVHFLPERGWLSDPLASAPGMTWMSWVAATLEVAGALALGVAGAVALRRGSAAPQ